MVLINHSNHPSSQWSEEQKAGWSKIIDFPFPNINPEWDTDEVRKLAEKNYNKIQLLASKEDKPIVVMLQGEFTYSFLMYELLKFKYVIVVPTTERIVEEKDGKKVSVFKFVRWRFI